MSTVPKLARRAISYGSVKVTAVPNSGQSQRQADIALCGEAGMYLSIHNLWPEDRMKIVGNELCLLLEDRWVYPGKLGKAIPTRRLTQKEWNQFADDMATATN